MNPIVPGRVIAGAFGMTAFAVAIISGLAVNNPASDILYRALISMVTCYAIGLIIGIVGEYVIQEHMRQYREAEPIPDSQAAIEQFSGNSQPENGSEVIEV